MLAYRIELEWSDPILPEDEQPGDGVTVLGVGVPSLADHLVHLCPPFSIATYN